MQSNNFPSDGYRLSDEEANAIKRILSDSSAYIRTPAVNAPRRYTPYAVEGKGIRFFRSVGLDFFSEEDGEDDEIVIDAVIKNNSSGKWVVWGDWLRDSNKEGTIVFSKDVGDLDVYFECEYSKNLRIWVSNNLVREFNGIYNQQSGVMLGFNAVLDYSYLIADKNFIQKIDNEFSTRGPSYCERLRSWIDDGDFESADSDWARDIMVELSECER